jgi:hypothetical protein
MAQVSLVKKSGQKITPTMNRSKNLKTNFKIKKYTTGH